MSRELPDDSKKNSPITINIGDQYINSPTQTQTAGKDAKKRGLAADILQTVLKLVRSHDK